MRQDYHPIVFRLRNLPASIQNGDQAALLLSDALSNPAPLPSDALPRTPPEDILISSLATVFTSPLKGGSTKTATLMFRVLPGVLEDEDKDDKKTWYFNIRGARLMLDHHFLGFTPLNDVEVQYEHQFNCVAISGLASHPFGSWQPRGQKTYMWLRDELPRQLTNTRAWVYGYDSKLLKGHSFQRIPDLASSFIEQLLANDFGRYESPSLVFLAHSLGGLVLKQAMVMMAGGSLWPTYALDLVRGSVFFGVPNFGMAHEHLAAAVKNQPNDGLIDDLAIDAPYLHDLHQSFTGTSILRDVKSFWAYETKTSPTIRRENDGSWSRNGPRRILVSRQSATGQEMGQLDSLGANCFPIDEDHSTMVKFPEGSHLTGLVLGKLELIVKPFSGGLDRQPLPLPHVGRILHSHGPPLPYSTRRRVTAHLVSLLTLKDILTTLKPPILDSRLEQIENKADNTFEWVFSKDKTSLEKWLGDKQGLFWIQGKPGSGKSTMMKYIFEHQHTWELLGTWEDQEALVKIGFFFHSRGSNPLQKSLAGLQRTILHGIIEQHPSLADLCRPHLLRGLQRDIDQHQEEIHSLKEEHWNTILGISLRHVLSQNRRRLHVCLFIDALDEFDGSPDTLKKFLTDVVAVQQSPTLTTVQICFSSRPWPTFLESFSTMPGFRIQDYTHDDIRRYCSQRLLQEPGNLADPEILTEITTKASGVFLWAKLALDNIIREARSLANPDVQAIINQLPGELEELYSETLCRIPPDQRKLAFTLLEIVIRSEEFLAIPELTKALHYSAAKTFADMVELENKAPSLSVEEAIRNACGGLLVSVRHPVKKTRSLMDRMIRRDAKTSESDFEIGLQPMHQTVKDFGLGRKPRTYLLTPGDHGGYGNGFVFLSKLWISRRKNEVDHAYEIVPIGRDRLESGSLGWNLINAERTTGKSMIEFFGSSQRHRQRGLGIASAIGLPLYLMDYFKRPENYANSGMLLSQVLARCILPGIPPNLAWYLTFDHIVAPNYVRILKNLYEEGYELKGLTSELLTLPTCISIKDGESLLFGTMKVISASLDFEEDLDFTVPHMPALPLLTCSMGLGDRWQRLEHRMAKFHLNRPLGRRCQSSLLHLEQSTSDIIKKALQRGMDPNCLDSRGYTPLDCFLVTCSRFSGYLPFVPPFSFHRFDFLISFVTLYRGGGRPRSVTRPVWSCAVRQLQNKSIPSLKDPDSLWTAPSGLVEEVENLAQGLAQMYEERFGEAL